MSVKKPLAIVATAAMVMTGAAFGASAANADDTVELGQVFVPAAEIKQPEPTETAVYNSWHFGPGSGRTLSVEQVDNGIKVAASKNTQIIKGNDYDEALPAEPMTVEELVATLEIDASGATPGTLELTHQIGVRVDADGDGEYASDEPWTTLRAPVDSTDGDWTTSQKIGGLYAAKGSGSLSSLVAALQDQVTAPAGVVYPISYGFLVDGATNDVVVSSYTAVDTTTHFFTEAPEEENPGDDNETPGGDDNETPGGDDNETPGGDDNETPGGDDNETPKPAVTFGDVNKDSKFSKEINWMVEQGITTGIKQADGTYKYEPKWKVTREAMAAFLYRAYATDAEKTAPAPVESPFADVKPGDKFYKEIAWMGTNNHSTGVKQAEGQAKFEPKWNITREAMAAFTYRIDPAVKGAEPAVSPFADVKPGDKFYKEIAWMSTSKLSTGIKQGDQVIYAPKWNTTREAMAAFIFRANN